MIRLLQQQRWPALWLALLLLQSLSAGAEHVARPELSIGGRVKLDTLYNPDSLGGNRTSKADLTYAPPVIPITDTDDSIEVNLRESRVWGTLYLPVFGKTLSAYTEFDFFDDSRDASGRLHVSNEPRLRHLYISFMNLTVGKTFTTFANMSAFPEINDSNGPVGVLSVRHDLARYQVPMSFGDLFFALEEPNSTFANAAGRRRSVDEDQLPDMVAKFQASGDWGNWTVSALVREIQHDDIFTNGNDDESWGAAISLAGRIYTRDQNNLRFTVSYGNVLGRYLSYNSFPDAELDATGDTNLNEIIGGYTAYQHWWTSKLRSSFIIGAAYANRDTGKTVNTVNKVLASSMVNLLWSPSINATVGIEWLHAYRKNHNHQDGDMDRLQLSAIYKF